MVLLLYHLMLPTLTPGSWFRSILFRLAFRGEETDDEDIEEQ